MTIKIGDDLPNSIVWFMGDDGPVKVNIDQFFIGKKIVVVAVPGAFTTLCDSIHLPGILEHYHAIIERGVDEIIVVSVNDVHVIQAWALSSGGSGKLVFLADGNGDFTRSIGMEKDYSKSGMGMRSKRYSMIVDNGKVTALNVEEASGQVVTSSAATLLGQL